MEITLVTSSFDKVVHGTENDRKTGCGINLLRPENVTRFHRTSRMTDLKEITCEKCKANLAKKLIKADKKEMALLLKEERKREKMGLVDEGIVPLGNTTAKITKDPDAQRKEEEARQRAEEEARKAEEARRAAEEAAAMEAEQYAEPEIPINTIPGTGVPIDESLAEFAITVPNEEDTVSPAGEDDFLAQFAIQKPDADVAPSQAASAAPQDDFLAQFAIPSPNSSPLPEDPAADMYYNEEPEEMAGLDMNSAPAYGQPAYGQTAYSQPDYDQTPYGQAVYGQSDYGQPANVQTEEDIMKMFSIDNSSNNAPAYGQAAYNQPAYEQPAYNQSAYNQPAYEQPAYNQPVQEQPAYNQPAYNQPAYEQPAYNQPVQEDAYTESAPVQNTEQAYGYEQPSVEKQAPVYPQYEQNLPKEMEELSIPSVGEPAPQPVNDIPSAPAFDEIPAEPVAEPKRKELSPVPEFTEPSLDQIPAAANLAAPAAANIPPVQEIAAPVNTNIPTAPAETGTPAVPDLSAPVLDDIPAPAYNMPATAGQENYMSDFNNVAPVAAPIPEKTVQPQQPQIITIPQLAGYDANNQPVYNYTQMKFVGVDQKGQPVYVPVQGQQPQIRPAAPVQPQQTVAPAQQTAAQAQRAAAPVQSAPVKSAVPRKPVQQSGVPTANISKIAVNPHSKSTSQAFINAIASSKEYAGKNLIETQGLKANSPVLTSVEDVLSSMGDDTAKKKKEAQLKQQQAVPVFDEYKGPQAAAPRRSAPAPSQAQSAEKDARYMSKAELKAKKKQDKIDAKFKKEMSKRGF